MWAGSDSARPKNHQFTDAASFTQSVSERLSKLCKNLPEFTRSSPKPSALLQRSGPVGDDGRTPLFNSADRQHGESSMNSSTTVPTKRLPSKDSGILREQKVFKQFVIRRVGVIGLGHMGEAFAGNFIADGYQVTVYDRSQARMELLKGAGATVASGLGELATCQVILTSLPDDSALAQVALSAEGLVHVLAPGAIHVSMSTISPDLSRRLSEQHQLADQGYVAAPVLGNPDLAHARKLFVIAAGAAPALATASPLLERLGQRLFLMGEDPGAANLMKLAGNVLTALTLESMGEVLALLRKGGIDVHAAFEVLTGSLFDGKVHKTYGGKIVDGRYSPPGMTAPLAVKDLRLALAEAERAAVPMPATSLVHDRLVELIARGWADLDWSALGLLAAVNAGLGDAAEEAPRTT
jgi:3-hydroxyisobutyrate dehydrogenase-like beta-hydroxyacid dehydrogenase